jgi:hypothetical protein
MTFAEELVTCLPSYKVQTEEFTERFELNNKDSQEYKVIIDKINGNYYWKTRENKQLIKRASGIFDVYYASDGSGYIKIENYNIDGERRYLEHVHLGLQTITYYGVCK